MKALYNNHIIEDEITLNLNDRAFQYGDGLFETICIRDSSPRFLDDHLARLKKGAELLHLSLPVILEKELGHCLRLLLQSNGMTDAIMKLMVWRRSSAKQRGYHSPTAKCEFLILCKPGTFTSNIIKKVSFASSIQFHYSPLSGIKTLNALPYIVASHEKQRRKLDELIVLNHEGFVCECTSSNIFGVNNQTIYTPPVSSGCLEGVTRIALLRHLTNKGIRIKEAQITPQELIEMDAVFCTNSAGIRVFEKIDKKKFKTDIVDKEWFKSFL